MMIFHGRRIMVSSITMRTLASAFVVGVCMLAPAPARAQWTATIKPTVDPLAIGGCGAVRLTVIDPKTKDWPRNPTGNYVTLADFDMTVASPDPLGVAGEYNGPSIWSACACQAATVGSTATITATYPAATLAKKLQVPGVAVQATAVFKIAKARGAYEPLSCQTLKNQTTVVAATPPPTATPVTAITTIAPGTATQAGAAQSPPPSAASGPVTAGPVRAAPPGTLTAAPSGTMSAAVQKRAPRAIPGTGPPTNVTVAGTTNGVRVWFQFGNAGPTLTDEVLFRKDGTQSPAKRAGGTSVVCANYDNNSYDCLDAYIDDVVTDNTIAYEYTVANIYANGTQASAPPVPWVFPPLVNPTGFTATDSGSGTVAFQWQPVSGALSYRLDGTGLPNTGQMVNGVSTTVKLVPRGPGTWKLTALFPANFADFKNPSVVSQVVRVVPPHTVKWLSKKNGPGNDTIAQAHYKEVCQWTRPDGSVTTWGCPPDLAKELANVAGALNGNGVPAFQAVYGNPGDLGFGRRASCWTGAAPPPGFATTICWASSHGPGPTDPGYADPQVITQAAMQNTAIRTTTMIIKDATGMRFFIFGPPTGGGGYDPTPSAPSHYILLDTEGPKFAPHTCMACHGGTYDTLSNRVFGATLLPLNPWMLVYAGGPAGRPAQEEAMRWINSVVLNTTQNAAVASYINGLYGGKVSVPGTKAVDDYVPSGWSAQSGLYKSVVRPYCATCHLAQQPSYSFASWGNFQGNAGLINAAVCATHSMPHAELPFKEFWTKNTGIVYLPGLLAASLGYNSC